MGENGAPYRRRLIGLPIQRSVFARISRGPAMAGLCGVLPGDRFGARLDEVGDLYLDTSHIDRLAQALPGLATSEFLLEMRHGLAARSAAVVECTARAAQVAAVGTEAEARVLLTELGDAVAELIPYGILSKFIPDQLLGLLEAAGDTAGPPFPARSPGSELARAAARLGAGCLARGFPPERLLREWPEVPHDIVVQVGNFCRAHRGFGPLAWEAEGYEEPRFLFGVLAVVLNGARPEDMLQRLAGEPAAPEARDDSPLRGLLAEWLDFLEHETWYVRRAFYVGMVPLLRRLAAGQRRIHHELAAEDLLFLGLDELATAEIDGPTAVKRRMQYFADGEYLKKYPVTPERLQAVMATE